MTRTWNPSSIAVSKKKLLGAGEMAQQLKALGALLEDWVCISSTHITCGNDSRLPATPLAFIGTRHTRDTHTCM